MEDQISDRIVNVKESLAEVKKRGESSEADLRSARSQLSTLQAEMKDKASIEETMRIWHNFSNYAEYKDLKALYSKVMPEIERHEINMAGHKTEIAKFGEILTRFDEVISEKAPR